MELRIHVTLVAVYTVLLSGIVCRTSGIGIDIPEWLRKQGYTKEMFGRSIVDRFQSLEDGQVELKARLGNMTLLLEQCLMGNADHLQASRAQANVTKLLEEIKEGIAALRTDAPMVRDIDCYTGTGRTYKGTVAETKQGYTCLNWTNENYRFTADASSFPEETVLEAQNYCRNPLGLLKSPWCYTSDVNKFIDECDIARC